MTETEQKLCRFLPMSTSQPRRLKCIDCGHVTPPVPGDMFRLCGATEEVNNAPHHLGTLDRLFHYSNALQSWISAGRPVRSDDQVHHIFETFCKPCSKFNGKICAVCGCNTASPEDRGIVSQIAGRLGFKSVDDAVLAMTNKLYMATESCPIGKWNSCNCLIFLHETNVQWTETRGELVSEYLKARGVPTDIVAKTQPTIEFIRDQISRHCPRLVINRAFVLEPGMVEVLAKDNPSIKFLTVCHSSQPHLLLSRDFLGTQNRFLTLRHKYHNCWYGLVDERMPLGRDKIAHVPNVMDTGILDRFKKQGKLGSPVRFSITGRMDMIKNFPNQILALTSIKNSMLHLMVRDSTGGLEGMADQLGVKRSSASWMDWQKYLKFIRDNVDIGLQASFSESFNYVAAEHLYLGKPVVGSPAIRYLPPDWQANPDDPTDIARVCGLITSNYDAASRRASKIGATVAERTNNQFMKSIKELLT
jgi:hypothetical protein